MLCRTVSLSCRTTVGKTYLLFSGQWKKVVRIHIYPLLFPYYVDNKARNVYCFLNITHTIGIQMFFIFCFLIYLSLAPSRYFLISIINSSSIFIFISISIVLSISVSITASAPLPLSLLQILSLLQ